MKPVTINHKKQRFALTAILAICLLMPQLVRAQADTAAPAQPDTVAPAQPPAEEEPSLIAPSVELISVQKSNNTVELKAAVKAKIKGAVTKLHDMKVHFFVVNDSASTELGAVNANLNGIAIFVVKNESIAPGKEGTLHFKAVVNANKSMEAGEAEVSVKKAQLTITPVKEDSLLSVQVKLTDLATGTEVPVKEATIGIYVNRLFNPLKIGEGTTDENGEATVEVPSNLPGDAKGNITLMARLDENETYGNLEASAVQKWGSAVSDKPEEQPRTLWSSHPPLWMLITFIVLMTAVWGHYIVIVYELIRLRKEQPASP